MIRQPFVYLASPYRHEDPQVMHRRFEQTLSAMIHMWQIGYPAYAPIAYTHPIAVHVPTVRDQEYQVFDDRILAIADELWVLKLDGWEQSQGVQHEILMAEKLNKHVRYVPLDHLSQNDITWQNLHEELVEWSNRRNELRNA
jgi:hypothetical protein